MELGDRANADEAFARITRSSTLVTHKFSGPIPPPEILAGYERVHPGSADRIITMAETESQHRREMERSIVDGGLSSQKSQFSEARLGQIFALVITIAALAIGGYTAINGHEIAGGILGASSVGGIVTTMVWGRSTNKASSNAGPSSTQKPLSKAAAKRQRNQ
jgi:uncharacterized membrane protein